jgi:hypothetical protein
MAQLNEKGWPDASEKTYIQSDGYEEGHLEDHLKELEIESCKFM